MRDDDFTRDLQPGDICGPYQIGALAQRQMCEFHVEFAPRPLTDRGVSNEVWAVIARGLEKEPRRRWPTA